ncbi:MAG: agmatinase [Pseudomonadota bacterium]
MSELCAGDVALLGVAYDHKSSFLRGPALAPPCIRRVLHNGASGLTAENGDPVVDHPRFRDLGDVEISDDEGAYLAIGEHIKPILAADARPFVLGGDHSISYPIIRSVTESYGPLTILHFDAHTDLYDEYEGDRFSHACPFARVMEHCADHRLIQIGIRSASDHLREQAERFDVETVTAAAFSASAVPLDFDGPVYVSFDMDVLDPAFAPGVSHHEPGGLSTRDVLGLIRNLRGTVVGADLVEFNPVRDREDITAMVAAKLVRELGHKLLY